MTENIDFVKSQTRITAHSGADQTVDNSLESIHYVLQTEADAFEVDVRRNAHGLLTLGHDEAGEDALLLSTVFEMMQHTTSNPNMKINCDLKEDGLELAVLDLATTFGLQERLIYSGTVDPETLLIHKSRFQAVEIFLNLENLIPDFYGKTIPAPSKDFFSQDHSLEISQVAELAKRYPYQALNMHYGLWNEAVAQLAQAKGLHFSLWTIDDEDLLRSLITQGVYAITTRNLQLALNIRAEFDQ